MRGVGGMAEMVKCDRTEIYDKKPKSLRNEGGMGRDGGEVGYIKSVI